MSYYAEIDEDTITVFSYFDEDESTELYWTGTINSNIDIKKKTMNQASTTTERGTTTARR